MTGWDNVIVEFERTGKVENCPFCGSDKVNADKVIGKRRDSTWFSCENCGQGAHYSGTLKPENG